MNRANRNRINAPIINRVVELNKYLLRISDKAFKLIKRNYIDAILKQGATLFTYAMRQLRGLDYRKRTLKHFSTWLYFKDRAGGPVCLLRKEHTPAYRSTADIETFLSQFKHVSRYKKKPLRKTRDKRA